MKFLCYKLSLLDSFLQEIFKSEQIRTFADLTRKNDSLIVRSSAIKGGNAAPPKKTSIKGS